ncbi:hypothetical protein PoB_000193700 [Plakobranchus ocellatus]|uniref:Uncharacterized protein n=1 Tax=Plakobranchus ocellatus TaxID=259542 RepID=A0AAV3XZ70_9GAST|nr:hypothetical protein PoB_000193700 [Plakobranchus ocellatus]
MIIRLSLDAAAATDDDNDDDDDDGYDDDDDVAEMIAVCRFQIALNSARILRRRFEFRRLDPKGCVYKPWKLDRPRHQM